MSEGAVRGDVLSRDELDALLATLADERSEKDGERAGAGREGGRARASAPTALGRHLEHWAHEQARRLSSVHQTTVQFPLSRWETMSSGELAEAIPPSDLLTVVEFSPNNAVGYLWLGRPLLFSMMALSYGAPSVKAAAPVARPYTRIEKRYYRHFSSELLSTLDAAWQDLVELRSRVLTVDGLDRLYEDAHDPMLVATFEVEGLSDFGRMRLALPAGPFESLAGSPARVAPTRRCELEDAVLDTAVSLRVEAGGLDLTLRALAGLEVGQVLPLDTERDGEFVVRIEGRPKFRGLRGAVGNRLAIQITERL